MHYLTLITSAAILGSAKLERTVLDEKPSEEYLFYPILGFGDIYDKESVFEDSNNAITKNSQNDESPELNQNLMEPEHGFSSSIVVNEESEHPEESSETKPDEGWENETENNDKSEKVATYRLIDEQEPSTANGPDFEINGEETSYHDGADDDDDQICQNDTVYTALEYITMVLMKTDIIGQLEESIIDEAKDGNMDSTKPDEKQSGNSEKLADLLISAVLGDVETNDKQEDDLSEIAVHDNETDRQILNVTTNTDTDWPDDVQAEAEPKNEEPRNFDDDGTSSQENISTEDVGKLLAEGDLFDYQLFANVYVQEVIECAVSTVNVTKLTDLPTGMFEAVRLVHNDIINKLVK